MVEQTAKGVLVMAFDIWLAFFTACWVISLSPGAGAIASMSSGLQFGFLRGYWNVIGLQLALAVQILIVAAGVGAVLTASALAFNLIKWFGVAYLVYLAIKQWQQKPSTITTEQQQPQVDPLAMIMKGFLVNISNPKAIVFMLAVLPQFIDPAQALIPQYGIMMLTMITVDMIVMAGYTCLAVKVLLFLRTPRQQRILNRSFASLFLGAASLLSFVHR
jgi:Putative threonine efflux protein